MQQKTLAKALGISPAMVSRLVKRGMPTDTLERAQRWRRRHLDSARLKGVRVNVDQVESGVSVQTSADDLEPYEPDADSDAYRSARAERERTRADRERLELDRLRGTLVDAGEASRMGFTFYRTLRDQIQNVSPRVAHDLAAESDAFKVESLLSAALDDALTAAANALEAGQLLNDQDDSDD